MASVKQLFSVALMLAFVAVLAPTGCGLLSEDAQEVVVIPPTSVGLTAGFSLGSGVRTLSFGPGNKSSPRVNPSGDRVAFILDGYAVEKPLYSQDFRRRTASDLGAESAEWLPDGSLAVSASKNETQTQGVETKPALSSLFVAPPEDYSNIRTLDDRIGATGAAPGSQAVFAAVVTSPPAAESPEEPLRSRPMILGGLEEPPKVYLDNIEGYVTSLSVSPDGSQLVLAVQRDVDETGSRATEDQGTGRYEIQVYRFSEGQATSLASLPKGMEILGAPQWTSRGVYFVASKVDTAEVEHNRDTTLYALYRVPEDSGIPELVRSVGEGFVASSISVSPDGDRLAVVGRRNPGSPTNLYVLDVTSDTLGVATANQNMEIKTNPRDLAWFPNGRSVVLVARGAFYGTEVYDDPAKSLSSAFYNLYEVPVENLTGSRRGSEG
ncbi:MAG: PD40 domain-containing protein [Rubrobacter sp.]|nr:PD40 domain-containing protein [Rubrobacter sp.]